MVKRTGLPEIQKVSDVLCALTNAFAPIIRREFSGNATLLAALDAAIAACALLSAEIEALYTEESEVT